MGKGDSGKGSGSSAMSAPANTINYSVDYNSPNGQITKTDAGQLYKAVKQGNVVAKPELVRELYDASARWDPRGGEQSIHRTYFITTGYAI